MVQIQVGYTENERILREYKNVILKAEVPAGTILCLTPRTTVYVKIGGHLVILKVHYSELSIGFVIIPKVHYSE